MNSNLLSELYSAHVATLATQYDRILRKAGYDAVVIHSGSAKKRSEFDDAYWPLRPTPHFQHWVGLAEAECALLVLPGKTPQLLRMKVTSFWEKPAAPETDHFMSVLDVVEVASDAGIKARLPQGKRVAFVGEERGRAAEWGIDAEHVNPTTVVLALDKLRTTKTAYEVMCLEEANRRAALGHEAVRRAFREGSRSELELHLLYLGATSQDDPETPYKNIVALGPNAATLHHVSYGKEAPANSGSRGAESLLLDAGATYQGYCSDVTRTWVKGTGTTASAFGALVEGVEAMQKRLCQRVKIGMPYEELHEESHRQVGAILREVGIAKASVDELVASGTTRAFFPHGLGHSLGLQTHDVGCAELKPKAENPFLRNTSTIATAQVFTIEPGIYFIDGLLDPFKATQNGKLVDWRLVGELAALGGVRIEDDLVVVDDANARNLTREHLPIGGGGV